MPYEFVNSFLISIISHDCLIIIFVFNTYIFINKINNIYCIPFSPTILFSSKIHCICITTLLYIICIYRNKSKSFFK